MTTGVPNPKRRSAGAAMRILAIAGIGAALGGCQLNREVALAPPDNYPNDYRLRHPITIKEGERTVEVFIGTSRGSLTPAQRADVTSFAFAWKREATGGILIDIPAGTPNARAARAALHEIRSVLMATGVPPQAVRVRSLASPDPTKLVTVKLNYLRVSAKAGPCGLWPHDLGASEFREHSENHEYWNFGCASQRNLAAMVENPADLVQPRGETPAFTPRRSWVLDKYRRGENTATTYPNPNQGKINDVGR